MHSIKAFVTDLIRDIIIACGLITLVFVVFSNL